MRFLRKEQALTLMIVSVLTLPVFGQGTVNPFPTKPVTLIVPFAAGGNNDIEARIYSQKLGDSLGHPVLLDFKSGATTTIGSAYVAKAPPDGHTLLVIGAAFLIASTFYKDLSYDPIKDFAPLSLMSRRTIVFMIHPALPVNNISEYIAYAKANPGAITFSTSGAGSVTHLGGAQLSTATNTQVMFVHYKGASQQAADLLSGRVNATMNALSTSLPHIKAGKLKLLAIASIDRSPLLPGVMTIAEQGVPGFDVASFMGILAPARTPPAITGKLSVELQRIAKMPDVAKRLAADGSIMIGSTPDELRQYNAAEIDQLRSLIQKTGITLQE
jgi:tripartite-type tricarboxylate transporter receptor subunit TctC